ncbi:MAG: ABC transporter permease [Chloroflexi bacterium]|nr:ABC transporter permease [Chloroflexota bacterium]
MAQVTIPKSTALFPRPALSARPAPAWWIHIWQQPTAFIGLVLLTTITLIAIGAPLLAPGNPFTSVAAPLQSPSAAHWLGTDDLGRDIFAELVHGARVSLFVGWATAFTSAICGLVIGSIAGLLGGWVDDVLMRLTELVQVMPRFFLAIIVSSFWGGSVLNIVLILGLTFWTSTARLLRAQVLSLRGREFVLAARSVGSRERVILLRHILPHALPAFLISTALQIGSAILVEAGLSFLGLGDRNLISWGYMLNNAQPFIQRAWWMSVFPGLALLLTVVAVNLITDGLNEARDPRLAHLAK